MASLSASEEQLKKRNGLGKELTAYATSRRAWAFTQRMKKMAKNRKTDLEYVLNKWVPEDHLQSPLIVLAAKSNYINFAQAILSHDIVNINLWSSIGILFFFSFFSAQYFQLSL